MNNKMMMTRVIFGSLIAATVLFCMLGGCERDATQAPGTAERTNRNVVVYTALDRQFSEPILDDFSRQTGIKVEAVYDTESTKTIGLVNRIMAERERPRCDVFWNNEIINTLRLQSAGLLQPCHPAQAVHYPVRYRDANGYWYGFAARARVLIVNTEIVPAGETPTSVRALTDPRWRGRIGMAKPLFGTTASHVACLFAVQGAPQATELLDSFKRNELKILAGNKVCAELVANGGLAFALTDTDDAIAEVDAGKPVRIVLPDNGENEMGTLLLPNTLAVVKGAPHATEAEQLIDFLLSPAVEGRLAAGPSAQIPLNGESKAQSRAAALENFRHMEVDFAAAAEQFPTAAKYVAEHFLE